MYFVLIAVHVLLLGEVHVGAHTIYLQGIPTYRGVSGKMAWLNWTNGITMNLPKNPPCKQGFFLWVAICAHVPWVSFHGFASPGISEGPGPPTTHFGIQISKSCIILPEFADFKMTVKDLTNHNGSHLKTGKKLSKSRREAILWRPQL